MIAATVSVGRVRAAGLDVAYDRAGQGPPLVLVHGAAGDAREWRPQMTGLADDFTVIAWDEPGAGRSSDVPADFGLAGYATALAARLFAGEPPRHIMELLDAVAADVRPESVRVALGAIAEADLRDVLPRIAVPTLLI